MKYGIVSYNQYVNFVNYGSILQSYALQQALDKLGIDNTIVDYCCKTMVHADKDNPVPLMQDTDPVALECCIQSLPDIHAVNRKFDLFWDKYCRKTAEKYNADNFTDLDFDGYICGSDTIWNIEEFAGFDPGYFADFAEMKGKRNITYSASMGDAIFSDDDKKILAEKMNNFTAISLREARMIDELTSWHGKEIACTVDPTLLLDQEDYAKLEQNSPLKPKEKYLLLYSRQYNPDMNDYADRMAADNGWKIVDISLRYINKDRHIMAYNTGIEEFLNLLRDAQCVVTNSFHGVIFSMQYRCPFHAFFRTGTSSKTQFLLDRFGLGQRHVKDSNILLNNDIDWNSVWKSVHEQREDSLAYLRKELL